MDRYQDRKAALTHQIAEAEHHLDELYTRSQERHAPPVLAADVDALAAHRDELTNELADLEGAHRTDPFNAARQALADLDAHLQEVGEWDAAAEEHNTRAAKAQEALTRWQRYQLYREAGADHGDDEAVDDGYNRAAIDAEFETYWQGGHGLTNREHDIALAVYRETREAFCNPNEAWQASTDALHPQHLEPGEPDHADVGEAGGLEIVDWDNGGKEALDRISRGEDPATVLADTPTRRTPYRIIELDDPTVLDNNRYDQDTHQRAQRAADQLPVHDTAQETSRDDELEDDEEPAHHRSRDHVGTSRDLERQL